MREKKAALVALGSQRDTADEQADHLIKIASKFQELSASALAAAYWSDEFFSKAPDLKLATAVVGRNEQLCELFTNWGHTYKFKAEDTEATTAPVPQTNTPAKTIFTRNKAALLSVSPEIEELLSDNSSILCPVAKGVFRWLTGIYKNSRGFELGTFDPSLLVATMHAQSVKWEHLALGYVSDIVALTHNFIVKALEHICQDERVSIGLISVLTDRLIIKYQNALRTAEFILKVERSRTPLTMNHYFNDNLEKWYAIFKYEIKIFD